MTTARKFYISGFFAWALTIFVGIMTVAGVAAAFLPADTLDPNATRLACVISFAAVAGLALGNANCAAAAAQHAVSRGAPFWTATFPALLNAAIFCAASVIGVHLGWEILKAGVQPGVHLPDTLTVDVAAFLVAFAKVSQAWVVEMRRSLDEAAIAVQAAAEREELAAIRAADKERRPERRPFVPEVVEGGQSGGQAPGIGHKAAVAAATVTAAAGGSTALPAEAQPLPPRLAEPAIVASQTFESPEAHARHLLTAKQTERAVARATGLTRYRVSMLAVEMGFKAA